jgi:dipeptidyl aminopeptidase/acylaminoacyl peptidase
MNEGRSGDVDIAGAETVLVGPVSALRFSPDGRRVAYQGASYIEVCDLYTRVVGAIAKPANASDVDPTWSPDGHSIAFRRLFGPQPPNTDMGYAGEYVAPEPWAILEAIPATHQVREIWRAEHGIGSAYYDLDQDPSDTGADGGQLFWSQSDDIGFTWERDGWRHLYAISIHGGPVRLLTAGEGEVETAALSIDRKYILYSTNIGDAERRHIGAVAFTGKSPSLLTQGVASQWTPVPLADGAVAFIDAGWASAPAVMVRDALGKVTAVGGPAAHALPKNMVEPKPVTFTGTDGHKAYGQLFIPSKPSGCAIVFVHGGITRQMLLGFHYMDSYSVSYELNQYFSMRGCVVLSVEYRSSIMRGYAFRNAPGWGNAGASEYKDVLGGAGFDMAGVHAFPGDSFKYSPAPYADQWRSPVYIAAGDDGRDLDFNQSIVLVQALRNQPQQIEIGIKVIPNEIHDLRLTFEDLLDVYWQGSEFMLNHLAPR